MPKRRGRMVTPVEVEEIIAAEKDEMAGAVAKRYGITPTTIRRIWKRERKRREKML